MLKQEPLQSEVTFIVDCLISQRYRQPFERLNGKPTECPRSGVFSAVVFCAANILIDWPRKTAVVVRFLLSASEKSPELMKK